MRTPLIISSLVWKKINRSMNVFKLIGFLLIFFILLPGCRESNENTIVKIDDNVPSEEADSVNIVYTNKNTVEYELTAVKVRKFKDEKKTFADTVFVKVYNEFNEVQSTLYSDKAEVDDVNNTLTAEGNVVVTSENGILKTPFLIWDREVNELFAKNGVQIIRNNNTLYGEELKTDMNLERLEIIKVSAEGKFDEEDFDW